jgi:hypothetical protein
MSRIAHWSRRRCPLTADIESEFAQVGWEALTAWKRSIRDSNPVRLALPAVAITCSAFQVKLHALATLNRKLVHRRRSGTFRLTLDNWLTACFGHAYNALRREEER